MQGSQSIQSHANLKSESVWFKAKLISQFLTLSFLLTQPFYLSYLHAAPIGGNVVGGTGSIEQTDLTTTINQTSQNLAVNWDSFNVNTNEQVNFVQPNTSSIALNRILGNNGSTIQGQINANGQVILVNPNGIFFTSTATINVGGLIASSLDMTPSDFMNGNYIFNEVLGADGAVINSGVINASLGGNVAFIGKQVKNEGLINAKLGSVVLAAGKQSILTFDNQGLIGIKVTKEVLQEELGLDEAIINSGEIKAAGGRVLLTASTSQDVFSQAVNTNNLDQATSVVVNSDGTFTLGGGADVLNAGSIDVSSESNLNNTARIVLLGENVTSSGSIKADIQNGNAGEIEIHATNKTLLTQNSITSAKALSSGTGGLVKILGDKVGLFDNSLVDASGINGGGEILIGGDQEGRNNLIRNAQFIYLGEQTQVKADALDNGNGGKVIAFAENSAKIHGQLFARGGLNGGNGGFIETSGLIGFKLTAAPDVSAFVGTGGTWLIDPYNITITDNTTNVDDNDGGFDYFDATDSGAEINVDDIVEGLGNGDVVIRTTRTDGETDVGSQEGNITFEANIDYDDIGRSSTLTLEADNDIDTNGFDIRDEDTGDDQNDLLNIFFNADRNVKVTDSRIYTNGGSFTATGIDFTLTGETDGDGIDTTDRSSGDGPRDIGDINLFMTGVVTINENADIITRGGEINIGGDVDPGPPIVLVTPSSFINHGTLNSTGRTNRDAGAINITTSGTLENSSSGVILANGGTSQLWGANGRNGSSGGAVTLTSTTDNITIDGSIESKGSSGVYRNNQDNSTNGDGGNGGAITIKSTSGNILMGANVVISSIGANGSGSSGDNRDPAKGGAGGKIELATSGTLNIALLNSSGGTGIGGSSAGVDADGGKAGEIVLTGSTITLGNSINANGGTTVSSSTRGDGNNITLTGNTVLNNSAADIELKAQGDTKGDIKIDGTLSATTSFQDDLTLDGKNITFTDDVGSTGQKLGDVQIIATGAVKAESATLVAKDIFSSTFNVTQSTSFTANEIDTSANEDSSTAQIGSTGYSVDIKSLNGAITVGDISTNAGAVSAAVSESDGFNGQGISLEAIDITVGAMNTSGSNAKGAGAIDHNGGNAGNILIKASGVSNGDTPSITINGDVNTTAGVAVIAPAGIATDGTTGLTGLELSVTDSANDTGSVVINYASDFTSLINITGSDGVDTLTAANRINNWVLTGANQGNLNTNTLVSPTSGVTFNNIEKITGGTTLNDTLTAHTGNNTWTFNAGTGAVTGLTEFNNINNLVGNTGTDDFTISGKITGSVNGGTGTATNTLTLSTSNNIDWTINGTNSGVDDNGIIIGGGFSNIHQINAGSGIDNFVYLDSASSIRDSIDGGNGVSDTLDLSALTSVDVVIGTTITSSTTDLNINGIETVTGNNDGSNTLVSKLSVEAGQNNTWSVTSGNGGNVATSNFGTVNFVDFTDLKGSDADALGDGGNDRFTLASTGSISGLIDAGSQDANTNPLGRDVLDLSAKGAFILDVNTIGSSTKYRNFEEYVGNNSGTIQSKVVGANVASTWTIDGVDSGSVTSGGSTIYFTDFNYLTGGTENDGFIFEDGASISGVVDGTSGTNDFVTMTTATNPVAFTLSTTANASAINLLNIDNVTGDSGTTNNVELIASDSVNTWNISNADDGGITNSAVTFTNVSNITGGSLDDTFIFAAAGSISGLIDGGSAGDDKVNMALVSGDISVQIGTDIFRIDQVVGNNKSTTTTTLTSPTAELVGADFDSTWTISELNTGKVSYNDGVNPEHTVNFSGFNKLQGRDDVSDSFALVKTGAVNGKITGTIDGGGGTGIDSANYEQSSLTEVKVGSSTGIGDIEQVVGTTSMKLVGVQTATNIWAIKNTVSALTDGANDGTVDYNIGAGNKTLSFVNFGALEAGNSGDSFTVENTGSFSGTITGGSGDDSFTINNGGSFTGTVASGGGTNTYDVNVGALFDGTITGSTVSETVNLTLSGTQTGNLIFNGNATATNTLNIDGDSDAGNGGKDYSGIYTSDIDPLNSDKLVYTNSANSNEYTIQYSNADTIQDDLIANTLTVNGTQFNDVITLGSNSFQVSHAAVIVPPVAANDATTVNYSNKDNLIVDGLAGSSDNIKIISPLNFGTTGVVELNAETLTLPDTASYTGALITAAELKLDSVNTVAAAINLQPNTIQTDISSLSIVNSGIININEVDGIDISNLSTSNDVAITSNATGNITSSSILVSSGALSLTALDGDINLSADNQLTGALSFNTSVNNDVNIVNTLATKINNISTRNLNINTAGSNADIHQTTSGTVISTGIATLNSTGNITLDSATNDFNQISSISLKNLDIQDTNSIGLNLITAVETKIVSGGDILDTNGNTNGDNITGTKATLIANTGIGFNGSTNVVNALETNVSEIDATTTNGQINIDNIGNVKLTNLVVTNAGNINFNNTGNVEINKVDAGFGTRNPLAGGGNFNMIVTSGSVTGSSRSDFRTSAHITAFNTDILVPSGTFGSAGQPVSIKVNNEFKLFSLQSAVFTIGKPLIDNDTSTAKIAITDAFSSLAGQQLIEIESIGDVDPAIFTDVRNYSHSDIALMMPADQRFDISEEEEEEKKRRNKLLQETP